MKKLSVYMVFALYCVNALAQSPNDVKLLEELANSISTGVNTNNHNMILDAFVHPTALIYSTYKGLSDGGYSMESNTAQGLSDFIKNSQDTIQQRFESIKIESVTEGRAFVTTDYYVTINNKNSHKGKEFYSAIKTKNGWKFISLMFTLEAWSE